MNIDDDDFKDIPCEENSMDGLDDDDNGDMGLCWGAAAILSCCASCDCIIDKASVNAFALSISAPSFIRSTPSLFNLAACAIAASMMDMASFILFTKCYFYEKATVTRKASAFSRNLRIGFR